MATQRIPIRPLPDESSEPLRAEEKFSRLERDISSLFDRLFAPAHPFRPVAEGGWHPFTDLYETETQYIVRMEIAGVDPETIEVVAQGRCLVVRGERRDPFACTLPIPACHQLEISYGPFERVICVPTPFDEKSVIAQFGKSTGFFQVTIEKEKR